MLERVYLLAMLGALACHGLPQYENYNTISYLSGSDAQATTLEEENNPNGGLGSYNYRYTTSNGISQAEEGTFEPGPEPDSGAMEVSGSYTYVDPNGVTRTVTYTAGVDGFRAQGDGIPTPVPTQYPLPVVPARDGGERENGGAGAQKRGFNG